MNETAYMYRAIVSLCLCIVDDNLDVSELFSGGFDPRLTNYLTFLTFITDVPTKFKLLRHGLEEKVNS